MPLFGTRQMTILKRLQKGTFYSGAATYLISNIISAALPFALLPILTRKLSTSEYGEVAIFQTVIAGLSTLIGLNSQGAVSVRYYDKHTSSDELRSYVGNCFLIFIGTCVAVLCAFVAFKSQISFALKLDPRSVLLALIVSAAGYIVAARLLQWQLRKQALSFGVFQVCQSLANVALSLLFVVTLSAGADGRIAAIAIVASVTAGFSLYSLLKQELLDFTYQSRHIREILKFGVPLLPHTIGIFLVNSIDRLFINQKLGASEAGIYMVAVQLASVMGIAFDAINNAYIPWLYERLSKDDAQEKRSIVKRTYLYFMVLIAISAIGFLIGPMIVTTIAGSNYSKAGEIVGWIILGQSFHGMYLMVTNYIFFAKRTALLSATTVCSGLINILLLTILVETIGLQGAAIAFATTSAIKFILTWLIAQRSHPMPWFRSK